nr:PREDICTED: uncharacterized protein LOC109029614 [Bemisia tabaci]
MIFSKRLPKRSRAGRSRSPYGSRGCGGGSKGKCWSSSDPAEKSSSEPILDSSRVQYWQDPTSVLTVDELARHCRRRIPRDAAHIKLESGSFAHLKSEYKRRFKAHSFEAILQAYHGHMDSFLRKIRGKPREQKPNFGKLGQVESEQHEQFVPHEGAQRAELQRKNTLLQSEGEFSKDGTEVQSSYRGYGNVERSEPIRQSSHLRMEGDLETATEQHDQFGPKNGERARLLRRGTHIQIPTEDMETRTENHDQFVEHPGASRSEPLRHPETLRMEGDIEFRPEYDDQFRHPNAERPLFPRPQTHLQTQGEFDPSTEKGEHFVRFETPRPLFPRPQTHLHPEGEFDASTEKGEHFQRFEANRPLFPRPQTHLHTEGEFESNTEMGEHFQKFEAKRPPFPRPQTHLHTEGEFDPSTEKGEHFQRFEANRPLFPRPQTHLHTEGEFESNTEMGEHFQGFEAKRPPFPRPQTHLHTEGEFESNTEMGEHFQKFEAKRPPFPRPQTHLHTEGEFDASTEKGEKFVDPKADRPFFPRPKTHLQPEGELEATSEQKSEFKGIPEPRSELARPPTSLRMEGRIEADPEYRSTFVNHPRERAVAGKIPDRLQRPSGGYRGQKTENRENFVQHGIVKADKSRPKTHLRMEGDFYADPEYKTNFTDRPLEEKNFAQRKLHREGPDHIDFDGYNETAFKVLSVSSSSSPSANSTDDSKNRSRRRRVNKNEERPSYRLEVCPADGESTTNGKPFKIVADPNNNLQPQSNWTINTERRRNKNKWVPSWAGEDKK